MKERKQRVLQEEQARIMGRETALQNGFDYCRTVRDKSHTEAGWKSAESFGVRGGSPLGSLLGNGDWRGRAASITCAKTSAVVEFFAALWRNTGGTLHTGTDKCSMSGSRWKFQSTVVSSTVLYEDRSGKGCLKMNWTLLSRERARR